MPNVIVVPDTTGGPDVVVVVQEGPAGPAGAGLSPIADQRLLGNISGGTAAPTAITPAETRTLLGLAPIATSGSAADISSGTLAPERLSFTKAQLSTAVTDGDVLYVGDVTSNATHTGDVTGATVLTIADAAVTLAKIQNITSQRLLGRASLTDGPPSQVSLGGGLNWQGSGIQRSALTGDVTAAAGSNETTIANDAVTYAKMQNVSAASRLLGRGSASGAGDPQEIIIGSGLTMSDTSLVLASHTHSASEITSGTLDNARLGTGNLTFKIDTATTGAKSLFFRVPYACTITGWELVANTTGSVVIDIWKDTYINYPPTVGDTITASAKPTLTAESKANSTTLTGWTTALAAGDYIEVNVDSVTTITNVTLTLTVTRV